MRARLAMASGLAAWLLAGCADEPAPPPPVTQLTPADHEPYFPLLTGPHANTTCNACHGGFQSFTDFTCIGCHVEGVTRPIHAEVPGFEFEREVCLTCHPRGEKPAVRPVDHAAFYPIARGTPHQALKCNDCHGDPFDLRVVSCLGCHDHAEPETRADHAGMDGFAYETARCLSCHRDGDDPARVAHASWFPIAPGSLHAAVGCVSCHPSAADRTVVACATCHDHRAEVTAPLHAAVGGFAAQDPLCLRCHDGAAVARVADHLPFRIVAGSDHGPREASCLECHLASDRARPWAADFVQFECRNCHLQRDMDEEHDGERGYLYESMTCVMSGCHPSGRKP